MGSATNYRSSEEKEWWLTPNPSYTKEITEDLKEFERVGCGYEGDGKRLFAIDVPPNVDAIKVRSLLLDGEKKGKWEWEIGYVTDKVGQ